MKRKGPATLQRHGPSLQAAETGSNPNLLAWDSWETTVLEAMEFYLFYENSACVSMGCA